MPNHFIMRHHSLNMWISMMAVVIATAIVTACDPETVYHEYRSVPLEGWEKNDTLGFNIPPISTPSRYSQELEIRINEKFPFTSLSLVIEQHIYPGRRTRIDTVRCQFVDKRGNFEGEGISMHQYQYPIRPIDLRRGDSLHINIRHIMRREVLPGISDIGIHMKEMP